MKKVMEVDTTNRDKWLEIRRQTIGASEIASIIGLNKYSSPLKVWMEKTGKLAPEPENDAMFIGKNAESLVASVFERAFPSAGKPFNAQVLCAHDVHPWATATPDFWLADKIEAEPWNNSETKILETKMQKISQLQTWDDGNVPIHYAMQVMWQLGVTGLKVAHIASLIGGFDFRSAKIDFDENIFNKLIEAAAQFREYIEKDLPPNAGPGDSKLIAALTPVRSGSVALLDAKAAQYAALYTENEEQRKKYADIVKTYEMQRDEAANNLQLLMGDAEEGILETTENGKLTKIVCKIKTITRASYTTKESSYQKFTLKVTEE